MEGPPLLSALDIHMSGASKEQSLPRDFKEEVTENPTIPDAGANISVSTSAKKAQSRTALVQFSTLCVSLFLVGWSDGAS